MLTSIDIKEARRSMRTAIFVCGGGGLMFTATFLFVLFRPFFPAQALLIIAAIAGGIGLVHGWYWTYRTACGTTYLLLRVGLVVFLMEILLG